MHYAAGGGDHDEPYRLADLCLHGADQDELQLRQHDPVGGQGEAGHANDGCNLHKNSSVYILTKSPCLVKLAVVRKGYFPHGSWEALKRIGIVFLIDEKGVARGFSVPGRLIEGWNEAACDTFFFLHRDIRGACS